MTIEAVSLETREVIFDTPRISLNGFEAGSGAPIIFLHGITANAYVWGPVIEQLVSFGRCISVSQRGHGKSEKPGHGYQASDYAQDLIGLVEHIGGGPAVVVGHSLGARNALTASAVRPDLFASVIAIDYAPFIEVEVLDALKARVVGGNREFASVDEVKIYLRSRYPRLPEDAIARRAEYGYETEGAGLRPLALPAAMRQTAEGLYEDLGPAVVGSTVPTTFVRGVESTLLSHQAFESTVKLRPDQQYVVVEGADHYVPEERHDVVARLVAGQLRGWTVWP